MERELKYLLIVDDEPSGLVTLDQILEGKFPEFIIKTGSSGAECVELAHLYKPEIILLDVMMPGMNGFEACKRIKEDPETKSVCVLLVTALDDNASRKTGFMSGADDYILKPIDRDSFVTSIQQALRRKRLGLYTD